MSSDNQTRVLLVDDDKELTFILRAHLAAAGYEVEVVHDAETALERAPVFLPDVVVMDSILPGINGVEAIQRLKQDARTADAAMIMVTARTDSDHVVLALEAGAQEYVAKPFEVAELMARIRTVNRLRQTRQELDELNGQLSHTVEERTGRLRTLYNFTRGLNEADTREAILDLIIRTVQEVTGSKRVSVLLRDERGSQLVCARATGIAPEVVRGIRVSTSEGIAGNVFATGKTYVASAFDSSEQIGARYETDSFVSTPLIATSLMTREEKLGVLSITDKPGGDVFTPDEIECIRSIADSGAIALHNQIHRERLNDSVNVLLMTVGRLAEFRDDETGHHLERVREYAKLMATAMRDGSRYSDQINDEFIEDIYRAAPMHDIGKVGVADYILCKPDKLTAEEFRLMQSHCRIGREVLESALAKTGPVPILRMCMEIAANHHERWDGHGYPDGLEGADIPLAARVIALVDAYDAITSKRRYKGARSHADAVDIIRGDAGKHFDPHLMEPFERCADRFDEIRALHADAEPERELVAPMSSR